jgi:hypothetical protein
VLALAKMAIEDDRGLFIILNSIGHKVAMRVNVKAVSYRTGSDVNGCRCLFVFCLSGLMACMIIFLMG